MEKDRGAFEEKTDAAMASAGTPMTRQCHICGTTDVQGWCEVCTLKFRMMDIKELAPGKKASLIELALSPPQEVQLEVIVDFVEALSGRRPTLENLLEWQRKLNVERSSKKMAARGHAPAAPQPVPAAFDATSPARPSNRMQSFVHSAPDAPTMDAIPTAPPSQPHPIMPPAQSGEDAVPEELTIEAYPPTRGYRSGPTGGTAAALGPILPEPPEPSRDAVTPIEIPSVSLRRPAPANAKK